MNILEGALDARKKSFGIVASRFNALVVQQLVSGAEDCLLRHGARAEDLTLAWVPGASEIPFALKRMAASGKFQALIALGCVIRGSTPHFEQVVTIVTKGVGEISLTHNLPIGFGVLTTDSLEQALERAGSKAGNKGWDAALAAVEMAALSQSLP
jgi:6,7-dimethyl-8-ribityllumazine synthase